MTAPNLKVRCAIYTRKSSEEGLEQSFNSLHAQREACEAYVLCQRHEGWLVVHTSYDDGGFSGGNMDRPGLKKLMTDIGSGLVDTIVVYKVDRLTRSLADFAKIVESLDSKGVSFVSVTQQFNTTSSMGRLTLNVLLSFAQFEREVTGERIRDKIAASKKKGMWMGGPVPLGYDNIDTQLVINQTEAETVRFIFQRYLELKSVRLLREDLENGGTRSKQWIGRTGVSKGDSVLSRGTLYHLLGNLTYIGITVHRGAQYPGMHEAIIDPETWRPVADLLALNKVDRYRTKNVSSGRLLQGLLKTSAGQIYIPTHARKSGKQYYYYTLRGNGSDENSSTLRNLPAVEVERCIVESLHRLLSDSLRVAEHLPGCDLPALKRITESCSLRAAVLLEGPAKQQHALVRKLVLGVTASAGVLRIKLNRAALCLMSVFNEEISEVSAGPIVIEEPFVMARRGSESRLILQSSPGINNSPVPSLVKVIAQARTWYEWIAAGEVRTLQELTLRSGASRQHTSRVLRLAALAPDLAEQILRGEQPAGLTVKQLVAPLPLDWRSSGFGSPQRQPTPLYPIAFKCRMRLDKIHSIELRSDSASHVSSTRKHYRTCKSLQTSANPLPR